MITSFCSDVFIPAARKILVFAADGTEQPSLEEDLGCGGTSHAASCGPNGEWLAVVGDGLSCIDLTSRSVRWTTKPASGVCIAVLPRSGVIVTLGGANIQSIDVATGTCLGTLAGSGIYAAGDAATDTVYIGKGPAPCSVSAFRWGVQEGGDAHAFSPLGVVEPARALANCRPMTIVPPRPGCRTSYLVIGVIWAPTLLVLALPGLTVVHTHELKGVEVTGLGADPGGAALVVVDRASQGCHVLPWPLPGMPPLD